MSVSLSDKEPKLPRNPSMEDLRLADLASRNVFKSSLIDVISDFEKNGELVPVDLITSLVTVGRAIEREDAKESRSK